MTAYTFTGFFSPINNLPAINDANAGSSVPIKFSLSGFRSLDLFAPGYPATQAMTTCGGALTGPLVPTMPNGFTYDPLLDQYTYVWKTDRNWRGCRQLIVRLKDGTEAGQLPVPVRGSWPAFLRGGHDASILDRRRSRNHLQNAPKNAPVAQWIEQWFPKPRAHVRFMPGALSKALLTD